MKKIYIALFALLAVGSTFTACTEEEPFATVTENDDPHILAPVFPDRTNEYSFAYPLPGFGVAVFRY